MQEIAAKTILASSLTTPPVGSRNTNDPSKSQVMTLPVPKQQRPPFIPKRNSAKARPQRPSLSEQLANIGAQADLITQSIRKDRDYLQPHGSGRTSQPKEIQSMPARCFSIGTLNCKYPSPVFFYGERCEYQFNHPYESSVIAMTIYYRDIIDVNIIGTRIRFKLPKRMTHFLKDFDPSNPHHLIIIELSSTLHTNDFKDKIMPLIHRTK